jgi:hypothetical protein
MPALVPPAVAPPITRSRARPRSPPSVAARDGRVVAKQDGHRVTDLPGTLADFAAAGTPEPVVLYRSLMTNPASTGSAYSAGRVGGAVPTRRLTSGVLRWYGRSVGAWDPA